MWELMAKIMKLSIHIVLSNSNSEEGFCDTVNVGGDESIDEWILCYFMLIMTRRKILDQKIIIVNISGENINVVTGDQPMPMVGYCLEDYQNYHHIEYSAPTSCNLEDGYYGGYNEFELQEWMSKSLNVLIYYSIVGRVIVKLSNILLQGSDDNDQYYNLLRGLAPITFELLEEVPRLAEFIKIEYNVNVMQLILTCNLVLIK
ncbi:hypothetical protein HAX54_019222 [Datura stramonium]|uniref:Uncharacterized protein n=1 Tax=Datura stramonium TaxID=4076 RepID=A0ABS8UR29_DATST|nr:hypothetical protein [Datura stramonium]